jgi:hypothetical protein
LSFSFKCKHSDVPSLQKPWQGSLPKPKFSPPKTIGDAVIKNSFIRHRGGQLTPKSFKMALPSMMNGDNTEIPQRSKDDQTEEWPPLLNRSALEKRATLAPKSSPGVQNSKSEMPNYIAGHMLIVNNKESPSQSGRAKANRV